MSKSSNHLTMDDRIQLFQYISENTSLRSIGKKLGFSPSTLSRELLKHRTRKEVTFVKQTKNYQCTNSRLSGATWVCHGCKNYAPCRKSKYLYSPTDAHKTYLSNLANSRSKFIHSPESLTYLNDLLVHLVKDKDNPSIISLPQSKIKLELVKVHYTDTLIKDTSRILRISTYLDVSVINNALTKPVLPKKIESSDCIDHT